MKGFVPTRTLGTQELAAETVGMRALRHPKFDISGLLPSVSEVSVSNIGQVSHSPSGQPAI